MDVALNAVIVPSNVPLSIVGAAPNPWHAQWVNRQQLLSRLATWHSILYTTGLWSVWDRDSAEWKKASPLGGAYRSENVLVEQAPKYLLRWPSHPTFDHLALRLHARRIRRLLNKERNQALCLFLFHPAFFPYIDLLKPDLLVYHAYDMFEAVPGWRRDQDLREVAILERADLVTAVSEPIVARLSTKGGRGVHLLPNGVDFEAFVRGGSGSAALCPDDLARIPHPRLSYVGSLHPFLDYGIIRGLAKGRPDWHFVLVGGRRGEATSASLGDLDACLTLPNVHWLGEKSKDEIPSYLHHVDVNLMLYKVDTGSWIDWGHPLKLFEYMATGRPIVSTAHPAVQPFAHVIRIARTLAEWEEGIVNALSGAGPGSPSERTAIASRNSWDARAEALNDLLLQAMDEKSCGGKLERSSGLGVM